MLKYIRILLGSFFIFFSVFSCSDPSSPDINPPTSATLNPIHYLDNSFQISWSENTNTDFESYYLYRSNFSDMSDSTLIFQSANREETSFTMLNVSIPNKHFFRLITIDNSGLVGISNIEEGISHLFICNFENYNSYNHNIGYLFISDTSGLKLGDYYSWIESQQIVIENPELSHVPDEIGITFILENINNDIVIETFLNIKTGSEWFIKNQIDANIEDLTNYTFNFQNIPDHQGFLFSTDLFYFFEYLIPITPSFEIASPISNAFYLKVSNPDQDDQFIWIPENENISFDINLDLLQNTQIHTMHNIPSNIFHITTLQKGYLNSGIFDKDEYTINIGTISDLTMGELSLNLPIGLFNDYYSRTICFYDNYNEISYHEVYGDIPDEFMTVNGEVNVIELENNYITIETSGIIDVIQTEWSIGNLSWIVLSPPEVQKIILPNIIDELNILLSDNLNKITLESISLEEFTEIESYSDYIQKDFEQNIYFWNLINDKIYKKFININPSTHSSLIQKDELWPSLRHH